MALVDKTNNASSNVQGRQQNTRRITQQPQAAGWNNKREQTKPTRGQGWPMMKTLREPHNISVCRRPIGQHADGHVVPTGQYLQQPQMFTANVGPTSILTPTKPICHLGATTATTIIHLAGALTSKLIVFIASILIAFGRNQNTPTCVSMGPLISFLIPIQSELLKKKQPALRPLDSTTN